MALFGGLLKGVPLHHLSTRSFVHLLGATSGRVADYRPVPSLVPLCPCQVREFAARKGTREKWYKIKKAKKLQAMARAAEPSKWIKTSKVLLPTRLRTTNFTEDCEVIDDVYIEQFFKRQRYSIRQAIEMHRETHHPTVYDHMDSPLYLSLELDMSMEKKTKFLDVFTDIAPIPHYFDDGKIKTVLAFCKREQDQALAIAAGADVVGGQSLIKQIMAGEVLLGEYKYIVCHGDMVSDINPVRGLLKKRFPSVGKGTLGMDVKVLVERFKKGLEYVAEKDNIQHNFGWADVQIGTLNMMSEELEANIASVVTSACTHRPAKLGPFISMALLFSPPSKEKIAINVDDFTPAPVMEEDTDDESEKSAKAAQ